MVHVVRTLHGGRVQPLKRSQTSNICIEIREEQREGTNQWQHGEYSANRIELERAGNLIKE